MRVASFTGDGEAAKPETSCRMVGPIKTPGGETFASYVQGAMTDELKVAGLYDESAPVQIKGHLSHLSLSSTDGASELTLQLTVGGDAPFTIARKYNFESSFLGEKACALSSQAFMPAVQDLLGAIAAEPAFRKAMMQEQEMPKV